MKLKEDVRVLIAEDDFLVGEMIRGEVESLGHTVVGEAPDGQQAVAMTQSLRPDVVLMDIRMPDMDGIEAARRIHRAHPTPVVVLTAYDAPELVAQACEAGVGAYLVKMPGAAEIGRAIAVAIARFDDLMEMRRLNGQLQEEIAERVRIEAVRAQMEQQLRRQERLAAVGQLAAGIAHDFRNLLTTIILHAQMALLRRDLPSGLAQDLKTIMGESLKVSDLVQQILDFSSRAMIKPRPLDLQFFVEDVVDVLRRTLPENVHLTLGVGKEACTVEADPDRMRQVMTNLALNARDAMPEGGELRIEVKRAAIQRPKSRIQDRGSETEADGACRDRAWVCLSVSDTGTGMTEEVLAHLFEPFFTTKDVGEGRGLGLAQVYGIVRQHEGYVDVETEIGGGTTVYIYLPACELEDGEGDEEIGGQRATILLVEQEEGLRQAGRRMLESLGHRVLTASSGHEALALCQSPRWSQGRCRVGLVITDVVMPDMEGKELVQHVRRRNPGLKALGIVGCEVEQATRESSESGFLDVIQKPFSMDVLARAVRRALDADDCEG